MQGIKAFVGHSFGEDDKEIVGKFLDQFRILAKTYPGFTWDHAEDADLKTLSEKVLAKIQDKNVFIGICTKRELAVERSSLATSAFSNKLSAPPDSFVWKTSDWIIQEIGLAIGRKMGLIIFLEDGVRRPGGLYGDLEYISFSREHPQDSFGRLLQMLASISPIEVSLAAEAQPSVSEDKPKSDASTPQEDPKPDWTIDDYEQALVDGILRDDGARLAKLNQSFAASIHAQGDGQAIWEARQLYFQLVTGKNPAFTKLKAMAEQHPANATILRIVGRGYEHISEYKEAAHMFERAADCAPTGDDKLQYLGDAAASFAHFGEIERANSIVESIKVAENKTRDDVLISTLSEIANRHKDTNLEIAVLEEKVEVSPGDTAARFSLAYKHSEHNNGDLALYHYLKIPVLSRDRMTWNNLGVSYGEIDLPTKAVTALRNAEKEGETLAMSNLGYKLLGAGFLKEAKAVSEKGLAISGFHKNVAMLAARLQEIPDEEQKKLEAALEKVRPKAAFYRSIGAATLRPIPKSVAGKWRRKEDNTVFDAAVSGTNITFKGTREISSALNLSTTETKVRQNIEYTGHLHGQMIAANLTRKFEGAPGSLLADAFSPLETLMYFDQQETVLHVMENIHSTEPTFAIFERSQ